MPETGAKWRRMDPGSLRAFVVEFTNHLAELGHTDLAGLLIVPVDDSAHRVILYAETPKASGT